MSRPPYSTGRAPEQSLVKNVFVKMPVEEAEGLLKVVEAMGLLFQSPTPAPLMQNLRIRLTTALLEVKVK